MFVWDQCLPGRGPEQARMSTQQDRCKTAGPFLVIKRLRKTRIFYYSSYRSPFADKICQCFYGRDLTETL